MSLTSRATALAITEFHALWLKLTNSESFPPASLERFAGAAGEIIRQKRIYVRTVNAVRQRFTDYTVVVGESPYTHLSPGEGLSHLINGLASDSDHLGFAISLPQFARSTLVPELDKYAALTSVDAAKSKLVRDVVYTQLTQGKTLDDAVNELRRLFSPNAPY